MNNSIEIPIESLSLQSTRERFVDTVNLTIASPKESTTEQEIIEVASFLTESQNVVCVYIDDVRYFTGFVEGYRNKEGMNTAETPVILKSKTVDLMQSTYIPVIFDNKNGGSDFFTNGQIDYITIIEITLKKLGWLVVDANSQNADMRFSNFRAISIINQTTQARKPIILDNKKGVVTTERLYLDGTRVETKIKSLRPSAIESVGVFLMRLANELGLVLTTNGDGDIVIEDASGQGLPPTWQRFTRKLRGDVSGNNVKHIIEGEDRSQLHYKSYRVAHDADKQNTPEGGNENMPTPRASVNDNIRTTRHFAYNAQETVNVKQQIAAQEMMAKTMFARSLQLSVEPLSYRYATVDNPTPDPRARKVIQAGDLVYVDYEILRTYTFVYNRLMYITDVSITFNKGEFSVRVELALPEYYSNPAIRPRRSLLQQRKLSAVR